ncbi:MAG: sigma-70 family RNA polymerase sigma factor [Candidatus Poribacteria bacterium]|nr:sigma-70 family RNA polymerase sigma factor [Candidatus Poribacteria bacterium]
MTYLPLRGKESELSDKNRDIDDEILTLIIVHEPLLRHIISLNVDDPYDRDDVYQETVVAILEGFRKGKSVEHPKAWMAGIAKNKCADFHRRDKRDTHRDIDLSSIISHTAFGGGVSIVDDQHQAVVVKEIHTVISKMKSIYRNVEKLHIQGHTACEISEQLKISEGMVKSRLHKFQQMIHEYLEMDAFLPK